MKHQLSPLTDYLGLPIGSTMWDRLETYEAWLGEEALIAGGIGPREANRLRQRHIADSLTFVAGFEKPPSTLADYGSGAGLPGIPLAIVWPDTTMILVDRSRRAVELMDRAVKILGLNNVSVRQLAINEDRDDYEAIVTRAVFPPNVWVENVGQRLRSGGRAVTTLGSATPPTIELSGGFEIEVRQLPDEILEHSVTLLIMTRNDCLSTPSPGG